ncbi:MAG: PEP-CTERM system TPR-repeat protein PrsT [Gammaproteobacteria bacterium]|nr:MAG: PEP-CTERM system TPR-repeat protein PrsT [Gammaproteobacteria bacterium]
MFKKIVMVLVVSLTMLISINVNAASKEEYLQSAKKYFGENKYREAIIELKNAIKTDPEYIDARIFLGDVNLATGQPLAAEKEYLRAKKAGAKAAQWMLPLGDVYIGMGRYDEVLSGLKLGTDATPAELSKLSVLRGMALAGKEQPDQAREEFVRAIQLDENNPKAYLGQASLLVKPDQLDKVEELVAKAIKVSPKLVDAHLAMTTVKLKRKKIEAAIVSIEKARELSPYNTRVLLAAADVYLLKNDLGKAQEFVDKVLKAHPSLPIANYVKAMVLYAQKDYENAKNHANKVLRVSKNYMPAVRLLGAIALNRGEYNSAQEVLQKAHSLDPKDIKVLKALADTQYRVNEYAKAKISLKKVLELDPNDASAMSMLGSVYLKLGEEKKGQEYMQKAIKIDPNAPSLKTNLALANIAMGDTKGAIDVLEQIKSDDSSSRSDALLAMAYAKDKEYSKAFEITDRLIEKGVSLSGAYNLRGEINLMAKNNEAALADFNKALENKPENNKAKLNLARTNTILGKYDLAQKHFDELLKNNKNDLQAMLGLVEIARLNQDRFQVQNLLEKIHEIHPTHAPSSGLLVSLYSSQKEHLKALGVARKLFQIYPRNADVIAMYAEQLMQNGENKQAANYFEDALRIKSSEPKLYIRLARAYAADNSSKKALKTIDKGLKKLPENLALLKAKVRIYIHNKQDDEALKLCKQLMQKWPQDPFAFDFAGDIYVKQRKKERSEQLYRKAIQLRDNPKTRIKLYKLMIVDGKMDEAIELLLEWYKKDSKSPRLNAVLAQSFQQLGRKDEAIQVYEVMVTNQPKDLVAMNNLAWLYMEKGLMVKAQEMGKRAYEINSEMTAVLDTYGWILVQSGKVDEGEKLLRSAISKAPQDRDIRYHVAATLVKKGDTKGAVIELKQALEGGTDFLSRNEAENLLKKLQ